MKGNEGRIRGSEWRFERDDGWERFVDGDGVDGDVLDGVSEVDEAVKGFLDEEALCDDQQDVDKGNHLQFSISGRCWLTRWDLSLKWSGL